MLEGDRAMKDMVDEFLTYMTDIKKSSKNTVLSYKNDLTKLIHHLETLNLTEIAKINETSINSYILSLERQGLSPATVSRNIAVIKAFILYLIKKGKIQNDPTERLKAPKVEKKNPDILSIDQINRLLSTPDNNSNKGIRDRAMLELLYATGIRVSELISLKVTDINLKNKFIVCNYGTRERIIPFGNTTKVALDAYLDNVRSVIIKDSENEILFVNMSGEPMTRQGFWKLLKTYGKVASINEDLKPQVLRNSFAVHLIDNGADIYSVQELLGHLDVTTTQVYLQKRNKRLLDVYMNSHPRL